MRYVDFEIGKGAVYDEVGKTMAYLGARGVDDGAAYERVSTSEEDGEMLDRYWEESKVALCGALKRVLAGEEERDGVYRLRLEVSSAFDGELKRSIGQGLLAYFVANVVGKWCSVVRKEEAEEYVKRAAGVLDDVRRKVFFKRRPVRPTY